MAAFTTLWNNHPNIKGEEPLLDKEDYENQCAINLYAAFERSGVDITTFHGQLSWQKSKPKYAIRAQEVANWLATQNGVIAGRVRKFSGKEIFDKIKGKRGVIFFQNYYGPGNQGDHIDLWDGHRLTHLRSIAQIYLRFGPIGFGSDYRKAESVWFWTVL